MRSKRIDIIKGLGIFLVVLGHTQMAAEGFINLFHVGLFFMAAGYCNSERHSETAKSLLTYIKASVLRLYVPFVLFNIVYLFFHSKFTALWIYSGDTIALNALPRYIWNILLMKHGETLVGPCWFIRALFVLRLISVSFDYIVKRISKKHVFRYRWAFSLLLLAVGSWLSKQDRILPYDLSTVCSAYWMYVFGMAFRKLAESDRFRHVLLAPKWNIPVFVLSFAALFVLRNFGTVSYNINSYPDAIFFCLCALLGWLLCWTLSGFLERIPPVCRGMSHLGARTLSVLMLHLSAFKIVTVLYVKFTLLPASARSAFPVISNRLWPTYLAVGILVPLAMDFVWERISAALKKRNRFALPAAVAVLTAACLIYLMPSLTGTPSFGSKDWNSLDYASLDYSLVYDEEYYLAENPDVAQAFEGQGSDAVFSHFLQYGMAEGRVSNSEFNVHYYKQANPDLAEAFGDDLKKYYAHYIMYGHGENRRAIDTLDVLPVYPLECRAVLDADKNVLLSFSSGTVTPGSTCSVYRLKVYEESFSHLEPVWAGVLEAENRLVLPLADLTDKYVIVSEAGEVLSAFAYITNPEALCDDGAEPVALRSKKGLQVVFEEMDDLKSLNPSLVFTNLFIDDLMTTQPSDTAVAYLYNGKTYYFKQDRLDYYDRVFSQMTNDGTMVCASVLMRYNEEFKFLCYPGAPGSSAAFYAVNTSNETGAEYLSAFVTFLSDRYDGHDAQKGMIAKWMVGNEVNDSDVYNFVGTMDRLSYIKEYCRTFRIIYSAVKRNIPKADVYLVMEPWWGIDDRDMVFGGEKFLSLFNSYIKMEGNIDWGIAHHAYSFPLCDPKALNDDASTLSDDGISMTTQPYFTVDDVGTLTITMENIDVLVEFMQQQDLLTDAGEVRSILLSEQGFTSNSNLYGRCEAEQAASIVYSYYKAEMNPHIDGFIYFLQVDDSNASLGNDFYQFGLSERSEDGQLSHKLSHSVFRIMDTSESLSLLHDYLKILGISDWSEEIPYFDAEVFEDLPASESSGTGEGRIDLSTASVKKISTQSYNGRECLPAVTVILNGVELKNDVDYDVVYQNNVEKGEATVIIVGLNDYTGLLETTFQIY